jgi:hypothetical protein
MDLAHFPWRPLGALLVEEGLLTGDELEQALAEQQRTGRLLGQIVVEAGCLTPFALTRALTRQHGVELRSKGTPAQVRPPQVVEEQPEVRVWRPLGRLLVENGYLTEAELEPALVEQRERRGRLGEILVARGYLSGPALARALAEQHGVDFAAVGELEADVETAVGPSVPEEPVYRVWHVTRTPGRPPRSLLHETPNFLDAADFVSDVVERRKVDALQIERTLREDCKTVWTYSAGRAAAHAAARRPLAETFGFDPTTWGSGAQPESG